jgi:hypothetical protein
MYFNKYFESKEEFDANRLGYYKAKNGEIWKVIYIEYKGIQPVIAVDMNGNIDTFHLDGTNYKDRIKSDFDLVEYLGTELPEKKEPRKFEFEGHMTQEGYAHEDYVFNPNLLYFPKFLKGRPVTPNSKWKVIMEEIVE